MPRLLHSLFIALVVATTSGLPGVVEAASALEDCCPEDAGGCPPSCDGCACRPHVGPAAVADVDLRVTDAPARGFTPPAPSHPAPPSRGVFHPPRPSA